MLKYKIMKKFLHFLFVLTLIFCFANRVSAESKIEKEFDFNIEFNTIKTEMANCKKCDNECTIVTIYKNNNLIDTWGNKCNNFDAIKNM